MMISLVCTIIPSRRIAVLAYHLSVVLAKEGRINRMAKILVLFYSLDGNTAFLAKTIADAVQADIQELQLKKPMPSGFLKFMIGGFRVMTKKTPALLPLEKNPADYDVIFLGTPIWVGNFNPAVRSFLSTTSLQEKKIALFCSCAESGQEAFAEIKQILAGNTMIGEIEFQQALSDKENNAKKVAEWAKEMIAGLA
jgi:flavodoxin